MTEESEAGSHGQMRYRLSGRVQGVGFRWWARQAARELGVRGTIRNLPDGTVEALAEGPDDALEAFGRRLAEGPPAARVERIDSEGAAGARLPEDFIIVH